MIRNTYLRKHVEPKAPGTLPAGLSATDMAFQIARHPEHETGETPRSRTRRGIYSDGLDLFSIPQWHREAECAKQENASLPFLAGGSVRPSLSAALACCKRCAVRGRCLTEALSLELEDRYACQGIRGGLTAAERREIVRSGERGTIYYGLCVRGANRGLIKIGTSRNGVDDRVRLFRLDLLATEPGSYSRERELHVKFERERAHGEWFRPTGRLIAHVNSLPGRLFEARGVA